MQEKHAIKRKVKTVGLDFEPVYVPHIANESLNHSERKMKVKVS